MWVVESGRMAAQMGWYSGVVQMVMGLPLVPVVWSLP